MGHLAAAAVAGLVAAVQQVKQVVTVVAVADRVAVSVVAQRWVEEGVAPLRAGLLVDPGVR